MKLIDKIQKPVSGVFSMRRYNAVTGETIDEYVDNNLIVNDSKEAIIQAISTTNTNGVIEELQVGDDVGQDVAFPNNQDIQFIHDAVNPDTIVRTGGTPASDFEQMGFLPQMVITVTGTSFNNGTFTIDEVSPTTITLVPADVLVNETITLGTGAITGTPHANNPRPAQLTDSASTMQNINTPTDTTPFTIGYGNVTSVSFSTTVSGDVVMADYPTETTKFITSAGLYTGNGKTFAYKRYPQKSISALINIDITWTIQF